MREWLSGLPHAVGRFAAFDTRFQAPFLLSGSASRKIARLLRRTGRTSCATRESFGVTARQQLATGELNRARRWGQMLATTGTGLPTTTTGQSK